MYLRWKHLSWCYGVGCTLSSSSNQGLVSSLSHHGFDEFLWFWIISIHGDIFIGPYQYEATYVLRMCLLIVPLFVKTGLDIGRLWRDCTCVVLVLIQVAVSWVPQAAMQRPSSWKTGQRHDMHVHLYVRYAVLLPRACPFVELKGKKFKNSFVGFQMQWPNEGQEVSVRWSSSPWRKFRSTYMGEASTGIKNTISLIMTK